MTTLVSLGPTWCCSTSRVTAQRASRAVHSRGRLRSAGKVCGSRSTALRVNRKSIAPTARRLASSAPAVTAGRCSPGRGGPGSRRSAGTRGVPPAVCRSVRRSTRVGASSSSRTAVSWNTSAPSKWASGPRRCRRFSAVSTSARSSGSGSESRSTITRA